MTYLKANNRPWCEWTSCMAGLDLAKQAGVHQCSYRLRKDALAAMRKINRVEGWAGVASVADGACPAARGGNY
jgi:hypothetical protein